MIWVRERMGGEGGGRGENNRRWRQHPRMSAAKVFQQIWGVFFLCILERSGGHETKRFSGEATVYF